MIRYFDVNLIGICIDEPHITNWEKKTIYFEEENAHFGF